MTFGFGAVMCGISLALTILLVALDKLATKRDKALKNEHARKASVMDKKEDQIEDEPDIDIDDYKINFKDMF